MQSYINVYQQTGRLMYICVYFRKNNPIVWQYWHNRGMVIQWREGGRQMLWELVYR